MAADDVSRETAKRGLGVGRAPLTSSAFREVAGVSRETCARLETYADLLARWQSRINLVGPATLPDLWRRHMLDSAQLMPLLPAGAPVVVDIGSGAGFPGLVLAVCVPTARVHLIEADARKVAFLREAARVTATAVTIHHSRAERLSPWPADVVTARALAPLPALLALAVPFLQHPGACALVLKGAAVEQELTDARKGWTLTADRIPSRSDPSGVILRISEVLSA